ncbi:MULTISPECIES: hypothetical protein [unclassified Agreia]|nr:MULTISPECIES: hypothetical protein [unclassified Agreia]
MSARIDLPGAVDTAAGKIDPALLATRSTIFTPSPSTRWSARRPCAAVAL